MSDMSHGKLSGVPADPPAKARAKSRKPGLRIDFENEVDPFADPLAPPDEGREAAGPVEADPFASGAIPAGDPLAGGASAAVPGTVEGVGSPSAPKEPDARNARANRQAEAMAAARAAGVPPALARIEVTLTVEVGRRRMPLAEILSSEAGEVIALDRLTDEPVDILVNGKPFARGEIVAVGDSFGVRLVALAGPEGEP